VRKTIVTVLVVLSVSASSVGFAAQSTITVGEGHACVSNERSRQQTEQQSLLEAMRNAVTMATTYLKSETTIRDSVLEKDVIRAYSNASVNIIEVMTKEWYKDELKVDCLKSVIKAEVIPDDRVFPHIDPDAASDNNNANGPLTVKIWTDKSVYSKCDKIKIYIKGNKPFYARVVYKDAAGKLLQLLPNQFRKDNYFNGNVVYEIPGGPDSFQLDITAPYGREEVRVFASTAELGPINVSANAHFSIVETAEKDLGLRSRGVNISPKQGQVPGAEFSETTASIITTGDCSAAGKPVAAGDAEPFEMVIQDMHTADINSMAFSPDGRYLATAADDGSIKLWDLDGKLIRTITLTSNPKCVHFSPDGNAILSLLQNGTIELWSIFGRLNKAWNAGDASSTAFFSRDGTKIVAVSDDNKSVNVCPINGNKFTAYGGNPSLLTKTAYAKPDSDYIVTASHGADDTKTIKIVNMAGTEIRTTTGLKGNPEIVGFSQDGKILALQYPDKHSELMTSDGIVIKKFDAQYAWIDFGSSDDYFVLTLSHGGMELWSRKGLAVSKITEISKKFDDHNPGGLKKVGREEYYHNFGFHKRLFAGSAMGEGFNSIALWNLSGQIEKKTQGFYLRNPVFSPNGRFVAWAREMSVVLWDLADNYSEKSICDDKQPRRSRESGAGRIEFGKRSRGMIENSSKFDAPVDVSFSPDGNYIAIAWRYTVEIRTTDGSVANLIKNLNLSDNGLSAVNFSPDGKLIAILPVMGTIIVCDLKGNVLKKLPWETNRITAYGINIFFTSNELLTTVYSDGIVSVWNIEQETSKLFRLQNVINMNFSDPEFGPDIASFSLSPDKKYLAGVNLIPVQKYSSHQLPVPGVDGVPIIWGANGESIGMLSGTQAVAIAFHPDGKSVLTCHPEESNTSIRLSNANGTLIRTFSIPERVSGIAVHPSGMKFLTTSAEGLSIWGMDGSLVSKFPGGAKKVKRAIFSPDGNYVVAITGQRKMFIWNITNGKYLTYLRSGDEWIFYGQDGYFDASKRAGNLASIVRGMNVYGVDQLAIRNNRPDIMLSRMGLGTSELIDHYKSQYLKRLKKSGLTEEKLAQTTHGPDVEILKADQQAKFMELTFRATDKESNIKRYNVFVNEVPLFGGMGKPVNAATVTITEKIELSRGKNKIEVTAWNEGGAESSRTVTLASFRDVNAEQPDLYFIGLGVSEYADSKLNLKYADKDVTDLALTFSDMEWGRFKKVFVRKFLNAEVSRESLGQAKEFLKNARVDDTVVLFLAGHGLHDTDADATYYYLPSKGDFSRLAQTAISFDAVDDFLASLKPRNKLLFLDTCESGEIDDALENKTFTLAEARGIRPRAMRGVQIRLKEVSGDARSNNKKRNFHHYAKDRYIYNDLSRRSGTIVFSSSRGGEFSYESDSIQNGFFTRAIIHALRKPDGSKHFLSTDELAMLVSDEVTRETGGLQNPTIDIDNLYQNLMIPLLRL